MLQVLPRVRPSRMKLRGRRPGTNMLELIRPGTVEIKATAAGDVNTYGEASVATGSAMLVLHVQAF